MSGTCRERHRRDVSCWLAVGAACLLLGGSGCGDNPDALVQEAAECLSLAATTSVLSTIARMDADCEKRASRILSRGDPTSTLKALEKMYVQGQQAEQANALALARLLIKPDTRAPVRSGVLQLARKAVHSSEDLVALHGIRVLFYLLDRPEEADVALVARRMHSEGGESLFRELLLRMGYTVLMRWGAWDPVFSEIFAEPPPRVPADQYEMWRQRVAAAIQSSAWADQGLPDNVVRRLVALVQVEPALGPQACQVILHYEVHHIASDVLSLYHSQDAPATRLVLAATALALDPNQSALRNELPGVLSQLLAQDPYNGLLASSIDDDLRVRSIIGHAVSKTADLSLAIRLWEMSKPMPDGQRAEFLGELLNATQSISREAFLDFAHAVDPAEMRRYAAESPMVRFHLRGIDGSSGDAQRISGD